MADTFYKDQLIQYLRARGRMPTVRDGWLPEGTRGRFTRETAFGGGKLPPGGEVVVDPNLTALEREQTLSHELSHAVAPVLADQYFSLPRGEERATQFGQAFDKLVLQGEGQLSGRQKLAAALVGRDRVEAKKDYRASSEELVGFGGGSSVAPNLHNRLGNHVDPTMATEMLILLDLAQRGRKR